MFVNYQKARPRYKYQFAVALPETGQLIGNCGVRKESPEACVADIGYKIDPAYWGYGYATEAATAVIAFGFSQLKLHRIWANAIAENSTSQRVLEKLGMKYEGKLRENQWLKNRWCDTLLYGLLEPEWRQKQE